MESGPTVPAPRRMPPELTVWADPAEVPLTTRTPPSTAVLPR